jgi:hypothetical protein
MPPSYNHKGEIMISNVNDTFLDEIAEAKHLGHKFMKIFLHPDRIGRNQKQIIISGAVVLKGFITGNDNHGRMGYTFEERRGDSMVFNYDPQEREYVCWLYDDPGMGYFSETGYNRDLLASHFNDNFFIIQDPDVYADVNLRAEYLKKNPNTKYKKKTSVDKSLNTIDDIDSQIKFLKQRKEILAKTEEIKKEEEKKKEEAVKKAKKVIPKKKIELPEKKEETINA